MHNGKRLKIVYLTVFPASNLLVFALQSFVFFSRAPLSVKKLFTLYTDAEFDFRLTHWSVHDCLQEYVCFLGC